MANPERVEQRPTGPLPRILGISVSLCVVLGGIVTAVSLTEVNEYVPTVTLRTLARDLEYLALAIGGLALAVIPICFLICVVLWRAERKDKRRGFSALSRAVIGGTSAKRCASMPSLPGSAAPQRQRLERMRSGRAEGIRYKGDLPFCGDEATVCGTETDGGARIKEYHKPSRRIMP